MEGKEGLQDDSQVLTMDGNHDETCWPDSLRITRSIVGQSRPLGLRLTKGDNLLSSRARTGRPTVKCTFQLEHNRFPGNCRKAPPEVTHSLDCPFPFSSPRGWLRGSWSNLPISLFHFTSPFSSLSPPQPTMGHKISMNERRKHTHSLTRQLSRGGEEWGGGNHFIFTIAVRVLAFIFQWWGGISCITIGSNENI